MNLAPSAHRAGAKTAPRVRSAGKRGASGRASARMRAALHAEWTKLRTVAATFWLLAATITLIVTVSVMSAAAVTCPAGLACPVDTVKISLTGIMLGQAVVAILAVQAISSEYSTGMIRITLTAIPRRAAMLTAKAAVLTGLVLAAGVIAVAGSVLAGRLILPGHGFTAARGFPPLSPGHGPVLRAAAGSVLYLALIALLSLGLATIIRDSAAAIGVVLGLLYLPPLIVAVLAGDPQWQHRIERYSPMNAGLTIQDTTGLHHLPISPWGGIGVLASWAAAALLVSGLMLRWRDA
jgi:ABC-2 type transport system permease protein